jgi:hypothetical protein
MSEIIKNEIKKIERKKFFASIGIGFTGLMLFSFSPIKFIMKKDKPTKLKVSLNPLSVKRKMTGANNV